MSTTSHVPSFHFAMALSTNRECRPCPPGPNCVWSGPRPTVTSASLIDSYLEHRDAVLVARKVLVADGGLDLLEVEDRRHALELAGADDPLAVGATSTPCGDLPQGRSSTNPGTFFGSSTFTPSITSPFLR